jgi:uncharacterized protein YjiS (DUF1127 family)
MSLSNNAYPLTGGRARSSADVGSWLSSMVARLSHLGTWWAERQIRNREMQELYRFSDRELWDVGLSRSDIMAIDKGTFRRE